MISATGRSGKGQRWLDAMRVCPYHSGVTQRIDAEMNERQREIYARLSPEEKINIALGLFDGWRELKRAWLESEYPDWTPARVERALRDAILYARD